MTPGIRDRLAQVRSQLKDKRDEKVEAKSARDKAKEAFVKAGDAGPGSPAFLAAEASVARLASIEADIEALRSAESDLLHVLAGSGNPSSGFSFLNDPEVMGQLEGFASSSAPIGRIQLGQALSAEELAGMIGTALNPQMMAAGLTDAAPSLREGGSFGVTPQLRPALRFLDLMPTKVVTSKTFDYVVESGTLDSAAETVEGAVKPEATAVYTDATAQVETIAHWIKVNKPSLADSEDLSQRIRGRLTHGVLRRLEKQVIDGDGVGVNIEGILRIVGIGSIVFDAGELAADQILEGIAAVLISGASPNVVAISITDWVSILKAKAAVSGEYLSGAGAFASTAHALWDTTTVPVPGLAPGIALVGDTRLGGRILIREGVTVIASDSDSDDFVRNRVTLLGECRAGLTVDQPAAWAKVDLAA